MNLFELIPHINTSENAIQFLRDRGILRSVPPRCPLAACQREMSEVSIGRRRASGGAEKMWRCPTHKSKKYPLGMVSLYMDFISYLHNLGLFLQNSNLSPKTFVLFTYLWAHGIPNHVQQSLCGLGHTCHRLEHVPSWPLLRPVIGQPNTIRRSKLRSSNWYFWQYFIF